MAGKTGHVLDFFHVMLLSDAGEGSKAKLFLVAYIWRDNMEI